MNITDITRSTFIFNPVLYKVAKEYRFIKSAIDPSKNSFVFSLESYEGNALITDLVDFCSENYRTGDQIINFICEVHDYDREVSEKYLRFLIDAQIIYSTSKNNIIGKEYFKRLIDDHALNSELESKFKQVPEIIQNINDVDVINLIAAKNKIFSIFPEEKKTKHIFYATMEKEYITGSISTAHQQSIIAALGALDKLVPPTQPPFLTQFINDFKSKYEGRKIPLLQAIDPEIGVGYGKLTTPAIEMQLLKDVNFNTDENTTISLEWSAVHRLLLKKWNANRKLNDHIILSVEDISDLPEQSKLDSPPTLTVTFRILDRNIYIESAGGATGTALIGRFNRFNPEILKLSKAIASEEQRSNPTVIFAEIGHFSDSHTDNINMRDLSYDYEIPINAVSCLDLHHQIAPADLWVSIEEDKLVLESGSLKKIIIPRLSSAYNYTRSDLAIFRILCDLQYQGIKGDFTFSLEEYFPGLDFYPRLMFENIILSPASWHLSKRQLSEIKKKTADKSFDNFLLLKDKLMLPPMVALTKSDQQLVFDLRNRSDIHFLIECLTTLNNAILQEFFLPDKSIITDTENQVFISQQMAFLYKQETVYKPPFQLEPFKTAFVKNDYLIGSKWLFLKIYCNPSVSNNLLRKNIYDLLKKFDSQSVVSWFFIRYSDPEYHIRLRLKVKESSIGDVLITIKDSIEKSQYRLLIKEYKAETYKREVTRYGPGLILLVEDFFSASSDLLIRYIKSSYSNSFPYSYHSIAFVTVCMIIEDFLPDDTEQILFLEKMADSFFNEFSSSKKLKFDLDRKYRDLKTEISWLCNDRKYFKRLKLTHFSDNFSQKIKRLTKKAKFNSQGKKNKFIADLIHMHLNRLFEEKQRNQELIIYHCLSKYKVTQKHLRK